MLAPALRLRRGSLRPLRGIRGIVALLFFSFSETATATRVRGGEFGARCGVDRVYVDNNCVHREVLVLARVGTCGRRDLCVFGVWAAETDDARIATIVGDFGKYYGRCG